MVVLPQPEGPRMAVKVLGENFPEHCFRILFCLGSSCFCPLISVSSMMLAMTLILV